MKISHELGDMAILKFKKEGEDKPSVKFSMSLYNGNLYAAVETLVKKGEPGKRRETYYIGKDDIVKFVSRYRKFTREAIQLGKANMDLDMKDKNGKTNELKFFAQLENGDNSFSYIKITLNGLSISAGFGSRDKSITSKKQSFIDELEAREKYLTNIFIEQTLPIWRDHKRAVDEAKITEYRNKQNGSTGSDREYGEDDFNFDGE